MKNPYIIPAAMICAAILAGFWILKPSSEPQEVIVVKPPQPVQQPVQRTPGLLSMAAIDGDIQDIKLHIARGSDLNAKIYDGIAPLHWAAFFGHKEIVELLIAAGVDVNAKKDDGETPMDMVIKSTSYDGHQDKEAMAQLLHKHGGKRGEELKGGEPVAKAPAISIHSAAFRGNIEAIKQHIAAGTDVEVKGGLFKGTPLHLAAYGGRKEIVELLIDKGADVNAKSDDGRTPLDRAIAFEQTETADLLRKHGGKTGEELKAEAK